MTEHAFGQVNMSIGTGTVSHCRSLFVYTVVMTHSTSNRVNALLDLPRDGVDDAVDTGLLTVREAELLDDCWLTNPLDFPF